MISSLGSLNDILTTTSEVKLRGIVVHQVAIGRKKPKQTQTHPQGYKRYIGIREHKRHAVGKDYTARTKDNSDIL